MLSFFHSIETWRSALGFFSLALVLVLSSPGVRVAQAEESAPMSQVTRTPLPFTEPSELPFEDAGSCQVGEDGRQLPGAGQVAQAIEQLAKASAEDVVVFNGTGHNYRAGNDALAEMRRIREEIRRDQAQPAP